MEKYLRVKYLVYKVGEPLIERKSVDPNDVDSPFVLMPRKDPAAFAAMLTYANNCQGELAAEIRDWLRKIAEAPPVFGTQGARNYSDKRYSAVQDLVL